MHRTRIMRKSNWRERPSNSNEIEVIPLVNSLKSGLLAGLMGALAMEEYTKLRVAITGSSVPPHPYSAQEWEATSRIALTAAARAGWKLSPRQMETGAAIVHYTTAAIVGTLYGALVRRTRKASRWRGAGFGMAIWLAGNEFLLPASGILQHRDFTLFTRADALAEHIVFGVSVDAHCRKLASP